MSDREKLIELLDETFDKQYDRNLAITARNTADHLISNGVTVSDCIRDCAKCWKTQLVTVQGNGTTVRAVPLDEIYRVIAGHSNYRGGDILSALTCIAEGKEVKPVRPLNLKERE